MNQQQSSLKRRISRRILGSIYRYWVDPLQRRAPFIAFMKPGWQRDALLKFVLWNVNLGRLAVTLFRVSIIHLKDPNWSVVYIGPEISLEELKQTLFTAPPVTEQRSRAFTWQVPAFIKNAASQCDLIVYERSPLSRWQPARGYGFSVPAWVAQLLEIAPTIDDTLKDMNQNMRRNVRKMLGHGFSYVFTKDLADFELFYHRMHIPYMQKRHGSHESAGDYHALRQQFLAGGLILISSDETPICGMLCQTQGATCQALQMGVHEDQFEAVRDGANVALWWFMMEWARSQGLRYFDFGRSRSWTSSGVFNFKRQWGTRALPLHDPEWHWLFVSQALPASLRDHLNDCSFVTQVGGSLYQVVLQDSPAPLSEVDTQRIQKQVVSCGLAGWIAYSGHSCKRHERDTFGDSV